MSDSSGFPIELLAFVSCQKDQAPLRADTDSRLIAEGTAVCAKCGARYGISNGILNLLLEQKPIEGVAAQEVQARDAEAESYDSRFSTARNETEIPSTLAGLDLKNKTILELGCGTGRLTMFLREQAKAVVAGDFSRESLRVLSRKLAGTSNVALVLADAVQLSLPENQFDLVVSSQLIEHIGARDRQTIFRQIRHSLRPGGTFVCTVYHQSLLRKIRHQPQDGFHSSQVPFHYFKREELRGELAEHFLVREVRPIQIPVPLRRIGLPAGWLSRTSENIPLLNSFGSLLKVEARKMAE